MTNLTPSSWSLSNRLLRNGLHATEFAATGLLWSFIAPSRAVIQWLETGELPRASAQEERPPETAPGAIKAKPAGVSAAAPQLTFLLDTLFLQECLRALTPGPDEELMLVSGPRIGKTCIPSVSFMPEYRYAHLGGVEARIESSHALLRKLQGSNHAALMMLHSHPGSGPGSVKESGIDIESQKRFERAGYEVLTGIFSRDGYLRVFSCDLDFRLRFYGHGVRQVGRNVFSIPTA